MNLTRWLKQQRLESGVRLSLVARHIRRPEWQVRAWEDGEMKLDTALLPDWCLAIGASRSEMIRRLKDESV